MVTLLSTAIFIIGILAVALYFWQRPARKADQPALPPRPDQLRGLFSETEASAPLSQLPEADREARRAALIERARAGDKGVLSEALAAQTAGGHQNLYPELLQLLLA